MLFARADSIYKTLPGCDVYDKERDARTFAGAMPVVAHPPCRAWGSLRGLAKPLPGEKDLAPWAVEQVQRWGGVLEHPRMSRLWPHAGLPGAGRRDSIGGFTIGIDQYHFGHRAEKKTLLYVVGCEPGDVPAIPLRLGRAPCVVTNRRGLRVGMPGYRSEITKAEREHTPPALAEWLVELARRCAANRMQVAA
ncbi:hypothetical protein [Xanthomonas sp. MUS 060]|uniref:hypothetical protein n=1 Tax=Xanthomonas sp. MUS 060 TaxID=1588031 RepID=UPI001F45D85C|nr:hypothetical protein [Xanthomonas sp. MUS 060]